MKTPTVNDKHLTEVLKVAYEAALKAREVHLFYFKKLTQIRNKLDSSLVSEADKESETAIRNIVRKKYPNIDILGEEGGLESNSTKDSRWLIDPLDGTTNYIHSYPFFCSSIALEMNGKVQVAVVDAALFNKTYWAVRGFGAFCNDTPMLVSESKDLKKSLIATGFLTYGGEELDKQINVFKKFIQNSRGVRRSGSAALDLCMLAEGCLDGFWEYGLQPWDTGAGSLIVTEAKGKVTNAAGEDFHPNHSAVIASNGIIHNELVALAK